MYLVYADTNVIHDVSLGAEELQLVEPTASLEISKAGSFDFTMQPTHPFYGKLKKHSTIIKVSDGTTNIFRGRVITESTDFNNAKKYHCEGQMAFLLDTIVRPHSKKMVMPMYIEWLIMNHNSQVEQEKQFFPGKVDIVNRSTILTFENEDFQTTSDVFDSILEEYGGYLIVREESGGHYIDLVRDPGTIAKQKIEFGKNLTGITNSISAEDIITVLIPTGGQPENSSSDAANIDITSVNNGLDYIENTLGISEFGRVVGYKQWSNIKDPFELLNTARDYLFEKIAMSITLELSAIDLSLIDPELTSIKVGDKVRVVSKPHGLDEYYLCKKIEYDLATPENTTFELGSAASLISEVNANKINSLSTRLSKMKTTININNTYNESTYVHQDEVGDALNPITNSDIDMLTG